MNEAMFGFVSAILETKISKKYPNRFPIFAYEDNFGKNINND